MTIWAVSPMPNQMMIIGIHAIGGIGRIISKSGPKKALNFSLQPSPTPSAMPMTTAKRKAMSTRRRLTQICTGRVALEMGFCIMSINREKVAVGVGSIVPSAWERTTHTTTKSAREETESSP